MTTPGVVVQDWLRQCDPAGRGHVWRFGSAGGSTLGLAPVAPGTPCVCGAEVWPPPGEPTA